MRKLILVVLIVVFGGMIGCSEVKTLFEHDMRPAVFDLHFTELSGKEITISDYAQEKKVILYFWNYQSVPCMDQLPTLAKFYVGEYLWKYSSDISIIAVHFHVDTDTNVVNAVWEAVIRSSLLVPVFLDTVNFLSEYYGVTALPTTLFLTADGIVVGKVVGTFDWRRKTVQEGMRKFVRGEPLNDYEWY